MKSNIGADIENMIKSKVAKDHSYSVGTGWDGVTVSFVKDVLNDIMAQLNQMNDYDRLYVASEPNQLSGPVLELPPFGYINYGNIKPFTPREDILY